MADHKHKKKLGFMATPDMVRCIDELCEKRNITKSDLIREALTRHLGLGDILVAKDLQVDELTDKLHTVSMRESNLRSELSNLKSRGFWARVFNKGVY